MFYLCTLVKVVAVAGLIVNIFGMYAFHGADHGHSHGGSGHGGGHSHVGGAHGHSHGGSASHGHSHGGNANMQGKFRDCSATKPILYLNYFFDYV